MPELKRLYENGIANGVPGLRIVSGSELRQMEPHLSDTVVAAIYAPTGGIVCPFELNIALAENSLVMNGVRVSLFMQSDRIRRLREATKCIRNPASLMKEGRL